MDNYSGERMTDEQFKSWLEFVNDSELEDAAYEGLVSGRAEIERKDRIIIELCDALSLYHNLELSDCDESCEYLKLIERARKEARQNE
jgi:hypothetical protein